MAELDRGIRASILRATTSGNSGAQRIGVSGITGLLGGATTNAQAALSALVSLVGTKVDSSTLSSSLATKANVSHTHVIADITDYAPFTDTTHLKGLEATYDSPTQIGIEPGSCYIPAAGKIVTLSSRLTITPTITANTRIYIYLNYNTTTQALSLFSSTSAPAAPYMGQAKTASGPDTTKRYVCMAVGNSAGTGLLGWKWYGGNKVSYLSPMTSASMIVITGVAITETNLNLGTGATVPLVPPHCKMATVWMSNYSTGQNVRIGNSEDQAGLAGYNDALFNMPQNTTAEYDVPLDSAQRISYRYTAAPTTGQGVDMATRGYQEER